MAVTSIVGYIYLAFIKGTLNFVFGLSFLLSKTKIPAHTNINANSVPMLVSANTNSRFKNNAGIPTTKPVSMVENEGVLNFGCILENTFGNKPSRLILIHIR